jgi:hypothetical protein
MAAGIGKGRVFCAHSKIIGIKESSGARITDRRKTGPLPEAQQILEFVSEHFQSDLETLKETGHPEESGTAMRHYAVLGSQRSEEIARYSTCPSSNSVAQTIRRNQGPRRPKP